MPLKSTRTTRAGLDRASIVDAAAALADAAAEGLDELTLAALAARLGVRTPSLYNHIAGLPGLRRELALEGTRELGRRIGRAAIGKASDEAVTTMAEAYRAFVKERPGLYAASVRAPDPADADLQAAAREVVDVILTVLAPYGLRDDEALHAVRGLRALAHGFATLEAAGGFGLPLDRDESFRRLVATFVEGLRRHKDRDDARLPETATG